MRTCYIPPENSSVYKLNKSSLSEYDLYGHKSTNIRYYSTLGHKNTTCDLNSGTDQNPTYLIWHRYIDMPEKRWFPVQNVPARDSHDTHTNCISYKTLNLWKENNLWMVNGRLDHGKYSPYNFIHTSLAASTADYVIASFVFLNILLVLISSISM